MKNKYYKGDIVECVNTMNLYTVKDYEFFDELILYYFEEGSALPEKDIKHKGYTFIKDLLSLSEEEKISQIDNAVIKIKNSIDNLDW